MGLSRKHDVASHPESVKYIPPSERKVRPDEPPFLDLVNKLGAILKRKRRLDRST